MYTESIFQQLCCRPDDSERHHKQAEAIGGYNGTYLMYLVEGQSEVSMWLV